MRVKKEKEVFNEEVVALVRLLITKNDMQAIFYNYQFFSFSLSPALGLFSRFTHKPFGFWVHFENELCSKQRL